ncbi:MAG: proline--tRNA ligase [Chloroflexi bacterium]|nr:proline--tRNA ligase [Chloroflexota bacterium]
MRFTQLFGKTLREDPAEADTASHRLLLRAGLIHQVAAGVYSYLPLALRSLRKIEAVIREEMNAAGGQEVLLPVLQPEELWQKSGRAAAFGPTLFRLKDRRDRPLVLGPTHEEVVTDLVHRNVRSYRDLPLCLYQIQTKLRDEARPRAGLIRVREFAMKDAYSFHADDEDLDRGYQRMVQAYRNIFARCGLEAVAVDADSGAIGGKDSQEFMLLAESGEDEIVLCRACGYAANVEKAQARIPPVPPEVPLPLEEVSTPGIITIADLARFLGIPEAKTLKAVFYACDGQVVFVTIRGDLEVNEVKLKNTLRCAELRLATDQEVRAAGLVAGYASPIGLRGVRRVADYSITSGANFVVGANRPDTHLRNASYPRDFQVEDIRDIAKAQPGHGCPRCGAPLAVARGIEVGHVFKLGTAFSTPFDATFLNRDGVEKPIIMGCYGIGVGRLLGAAIESHHDEKGILFPPALAPFPVHLVALNQERSDVRDAAESVYVGLQAAGVEVLYDDREESAGVKFNDADLLGMPVRVTVSPRTLREGKVELKRRADPPASARLVSLPEAPKAVQDMLAPSPPTGDQ